MKKKRFNLTIFDNTEKDKGRYVNILLAIADKNVAIHILDNGNQNKLFVDDFSDC